MTKRKKKNKHTAGPLRERIFRAAILTIVIVFLLFSVTQLAFVFYFNNKIKNYLVTELYKQTKGEYKLSIKTFKTNLFNQSVYITDAVFIPDKSVNPDKPKYYASAEKISLVDFKLFAYLFHKDLIFDELRFDTPTGKIYRNKKSQQKKSSSKKYTSYQMIKKSLHSLTIKEIVIKNADINFYEDTGDVLPSLKSKDNLLKISNLRINKESDRSQRWFITDKVTFTLNRFSYLPKNMLYTFRVKKLVATSPDSTLVIDSIQMIPNYNKQEFGYKAGKQTDRMDISVRKASFSKMNIQLFLERNSFIARSLKADRLLLEAYRDKNVEPKPKRAKAVQELIKSIPAYLRIDTIHVTNSIITYLEVPKGATLPGKVFFSKVNTTLTGATNDKSAITHNSFLTMNGTALLMGKGYMLAHYDFPMETDSMVFDCSGKLTNFKLPDINPTIEPLAYMTIKGGEVDTLIFNFHANEKESKGKMEVRYHDLDVKLLKNNDVKNSKIKNFLTLPSKRILVVLIVKHNNPTKDKDVRITEIEYPRNPQKFIFNYTWRSILSGVKPAMGVPGKTKKIKEPPPK
ncbi:MAG: hypothetical protein JWN78_3257 [Bacteroidota bacterium]|nr:hypothetical protein [Bacteroidota bacterium]